MTPKVRDRKNQMGYETKHVLCKKNYIRHRKNYIGHRKNYIRPFFATRNRLKHKSVCSVFETDLTFCSTCNYTSHTTNAAYSVAHAFHRACYRRNFQNALRALHFTSITLFATKNGVLNIANLNSNMRILFIDPLPGFHSIYICSVIGFLFVT